jgi:hypothetical protein
VAAHPGRPSARACSNNTSPVAVVLEADTANVVALLLVQGLAEAADALAEAAYTALAPQAVVAVAAA